MPSHLNEHDKFGFTVPLLILVVSIVSSFLPRVLATSQMFKEYFSVVNVFTAGLQLATILLDLIPHMSMNAHSHHHKEDLYPLLASGFCFLLLLAIDSIFLHSEKKEHKKDHHHTQNCTHQKECHENLGTCNTAAIANSKSKKEAVLFLLAISIHSFLEGLALETDLKHIPLLAGMLFHKVLESFAIGTSMHHSVFSNASKLSLLLVYSLLTPAAILIKNLSFITQFKNIQSWFNGFCLGALLFVVFFEVIGHSFHGGKHNYKKVFSICLGYLIGSAAIILGHSHGHHHHH